MAALNNRGNTLLALRRPAEALECFDRVLALDPSLTQSAVNRGNALRDLGRIEDAVASFAQVLQSMPASTEALANHAIALRELRLFEDAARSFARLAEVAPDYPDVSGDNVDCLLHSSDWEGLPGHIQRVADAVKCGRRAALPFALLAISQSLPQQLQCARVFVADRCPGTSKPLWTGTRYRHARIQVAYPSADFHDHATAYLMAEFFELHDRRRAVVRLARIDLRWQFICRPRQR